MAKNEASSYNSNPFTLSFSALGKFFSANLWWAIALIALEVFYLFMQLVSSIIDALSSNQQYSGSTYSTATYSSTATDSALSSPEIVGIVFLVILFALIGLAILGVFVAVGTYIQGMYAHVALASQDDKSVSFGEAFHAVSKRFWRLLGAQFLAGVKIFGGLLLFIVPGIRAALRYTQLPYVIMADSESTKGIGASHTRTKTLVKGRLMEIFGIQTVAGLIPFVGSSIGHAGQAALHKQLAHYNDNKLQKPGVHWLNYLGLILIGGILLFVGLIALLIVMISQS